MKTDVVQLLENPWLALGATIGVIMGYLSVNAIMLIWLERKLSARIQRRRCHCRRFLCFAAGTDMTDNNLPPLPPHSTR